MADVVNAISLPCVLEYRRHDLYGSVWITHVRTGQAHQKKSSLLSSTDLQTSFSFSYGTNVRARLQTPFKYTYAEKMSSIPIYLQLPAVTSFIQMSRDWGSAEDVCLGEQTFRLYCEEFIQHSRSINDEWDWEHSQGSEDGYMKKILLKAANGSAPAAWDDQRNVQGENGELELEAQHRVYEELEDPGADCSITTGPEVTRYEYHVVYSSSYQSPVLYFRACMLDGRPLSLEEIWESVHDNYKDRLLQGPWDTITQQEHPLLGQPFFILHPCRTHEFMTPIIQAAKEENRHLNVITAWLSMVGPVVGLALPISYATAASKHKTAPD